MVPPCDLHLGGSLPQEGPWLVLRWPEDGAPPPCLALWPCPSCQDGSPPSPPTLGNRPCLSLGTSDWDRDSGPRSARLGALISVDCGSVVQVLALDNARRFLKKIDLHEKP